MGEAEALAELLEHGAFLRVHAAFGAGDERRERDQEPALVVAFDRLGDAFDGAFDAVLVDVVDFFLDLAVVEGFAREGRVQHAELGVLTVRQRPIGQRDQKRSREERRCVPALRRRLVLRDPLRNGLARVLDGHGLVLPVCRSQP